METVRFAFYKPQNLWGWLIAGWTGLFNWGTPAYCHAEIGILIDGEWKYYSSASRNTSGRTGTRWLAEDVVLKNPERWDVYEVEAVRPVWAMIQTCDNELGKEYDNLGILGFVTLFGLLNYKDKWYCSEVCFYIFFGWWKKRISPRALFAKIKKFVKSP